MKPAAINIRDGRFVIYDANTGKIIIEEFYNIIEAAIKRCKYLGYVPETITQFSTEKVEIEGETYRIKKSTTLGRLYI